MSDDDPVMRLTSVYETHIATMRFYFQLFTTLVVGVAAAVAVFGYTSLRDIKSSVNETVGNEVPLAVARRLNLDKQTSKELEEQVKAVERLKESLKKEQAAFDQWKAFREAQRKKFEETFKDELEVLAYFQGAALLDKAGLPSAIYDIIVESSKDGKFQDTKWIQKARVRLYALVEEYQNGKKTIDANTYFNAGTVAARIQDPNLAYRLGKIAAELEPSPAHLARFIRQEVELGQNIEKNRTKIHELITNISLKSPEIVLAEAWNIAETTRTYRPFINAIDVAVRNGEHEGFHVPSYAHTINSPLKKAHMPGCHPTASRTAAKAVSSSFEMMRTI